MTNAIKRLFQRLSGKRTTIIPVVRLQGVIAADQRSGRLNIAGVGPLLKRAFEIKSAPAVAIVAHTRPLARMIERSADIGSPSTAGPPLPCHAVSSGFCRNREGGPR